MYITCTLHNTVYIALCTLYTIHTTVHVFRYLIAGVEKTVTLVKNSQQFLDDPNLEKNFLKMRDDLRKVYQHKQDNI